MMLIDKLLLGVIIPLMFILAFLTFQLARKDPRLWLTPKRWAWYVLLYREAWSFFEKLQPKENQGLLSRREEHERDQRR